jgi:cytidyltransferase-like protein
MNFNLYKPIDGDSIKDRYKETQFLKKVFDIVSSSGSKCFLNCGTLLGAVRNGKIIDFDSDMDILAILNPDDYWTCPLHGSKLYQVELLHRLQQEFYIKFFNERKYISVIPKDYSDFNLNHIDIGFFQSERQSYFPLFMLDELDDILLYDIPFKCPKHSELYLRLRYGEDWMTPKENFSPVDMLTPFKKHYTCYTSMVGDFFHAGHLNLLKRCKQTFSKVIVGIHNDEDVMTYKPQPAQPYSIRLKNIRDSGLFDEIVENAPILTTDKLLDDLKADFVVAGKENMDIIHKLYPVDRSRLHLIERTPGVSSRDIRASLGLLNQP